MSYILGLIAGAGEFAGGAAAELSGSELLGTIAGQEVAGAIGGQVKEVIDTTLSTVVDTIFGTDVYENKKKDFYNSLEEAKALGLFSGNIGSEKEILQTIRDSNYTENELINTVHNFAHDFSDEVSKKGINLNIPLDQNSSADGVLSQLSQQNPIYYYLVNKLLDKTGELVIPTDESYQQVAAVYNGKDNNFAGQIAKTSFDGTNTIWTEYDEVGQEYSWIFPLMNLTYTPMKSIWGVYVGLSSPNNGPPMRGIIDGKVVESYLDKLAFFHDLDYGRYSNFSLLADQKMISRAAQNKDKFVFPGEALVANIAINYFSTLGNVMRKMMGDQGPDPIIKDLFKDVYNKDVTNDDLNRYINHRPIIGNSSDRLIGLINSLEIQID